MVTECNWDVARFLIFSSNGEPLIYYSHLTSILIFLGLFGFTFLKLKQWPKGSFRLIAASYIVWLFCDVTLWANDKPDNVIFFWTVLEMVEPLIFIGAYAFFTSFLDNKTLSKNNWIFITLLILPALIFGVLGLSVIGFDLTNCDRNALEGFGVYYDYFVEFLLLFVVIVKSVFKVRSVKKGYERTKIILVSAGTCALFFGFLAANLLATWTGDYVDSQYGHVAVPIFAAFLAFITIKYESFEPHVLLIDTLVVTLLILLCSSLFVDNYNYQLYVNILTFIIAIPLSYTLATGIRREVRIRKEVQSLAKELELSNEQQVILIHFITHQIKGFVAKSRNIFSMALEGDFGPVGPELKPMLQAGFDSDTKGATVIQEILNAANIKSGKVTYTMEAFDLRPLIEDMVNYHNASAKEKGISVEMELGTGPVRVLGDRAQLMNVFKNVIDNSIKYTPKGEVRISLTPEPEKKMILFAIKDTGVGITPEDMANLFTEGGHGKDSVKVNVESTGFGLYIVKQIVDAHKGRVWAESEGAGKGTQFYVELPAA